MEKYSGKRALVTGGSSGIGLSIARLLAAEGARVMVTGRAESALETAVFATNTKGPTSPCSGCCRYWPRAVA